MAKPMVFKLGQYAVKTWRRRKSPKLLLQVIVGVAFADYIVALNTKIRTA